jgi:hypothetical protein
VQGNVFAGRLWPLEWIENEGGLYRRCVLERDNVLHFLVNARNVCALTAKKPLDEISESM